MLDAAMSAASAFGALGLLLVGALFVRSLRSGATPLIQRFALAEDPIAAQKAPATRYLRALTALWAIALFVAAAFVIRRAAGDPVLPGVAGTGVTFAPMLLLFFGERRVRPHVLGEGAVGPVALQWRIASEILRDEMRSIALFIFGRTAPVIRPLDSMRTGIVWRHGECTLEALQSAACALADRLPSGRRVLVVCEDRAIFLWAVLAVWAARRTVVLSPPDLETASNPPGTDAFDCVLTDRPEMVSHAEVLAVGLDQLHEAIQTGTRPSRPIKLSPTHVAAVFFTSGTSGKPAAHAKTWRQLTAGADAMRALLQSESKSPLIGGTVVHSHKFGFEMLVMQTLRGSAALWGHRIVFPGDLAEFCAQRRTEKWLVTTPFHLGAFAEGGHLPAGLARVVSATMPLDADLASRIEAGCELEVHEIYGSTEAGCIASRRTARCSGWRLAKDLQLIIDSDRAAVLLGERVGGALALRDRVTALDEGFALIGRDIDLVKVAGKRTSLQALTATLLGIDGVTDGVVIDGAAIGQRRLAAFVVAPGVSGDAIRAALARRIDAAFVPRPIMLVDRLPRDANGKLRAEALSALLETMPRRFAPLTTEGLEPHAR